MKTEHPITPPPELVQAFLRSNPFTPAEMTYEQFIATRFARWGADQELEACCEEMKSIPSPLGIPFGEMASNALLAARRPKPPSLKEQALKAVQNIDDACESEGFSRADDTDIIRRALEALPDV